MELRKSEGLLLQCVEAGGDPRRLLDYIVELETEKFTLLTECGEIDFSALKQRMYTLEDDVSRLRESSSIRNAHVVDASPDADALGAEETRFSNCSSPRILESRSINGCGIDGSSDISGGGEDAALASIVASTELSVLTTAATATAKGSRSHSIHRPRLSSGSAPLYTLPESFRYDLSLRDTKEKSLTLRPADVASPTAVGGGASAIATTAVEASPHVHGSTRRHKDIANITARIRSPSAATTAAPPQQQSKQKPKKTRKEVATASLVAESIKRTADVVGTAQQQQQQQRKAALRSLMHGKGQPIAVASASAAVAAKARNKLPSISAAALKDDDSESGEDEHDGEDLDKYLLQSEQRTNNGVAINGAIATTATADDDEASLSSHDSQQLLEASGSFYAGTDDGSGSGGGFDIDLISSADEGDDIHSSGSGSAAAADADRDAEAESNQLEFCIVEADWSHLQSVTDRLTPLLPPRRTWKYPGDIAHSAATVASAARQQRNSSGSAASTSATAAGETKTMDLQEQNFLFPSGVKVDLVWPSVAALQTRKRSEIRHIVPFTDSRGRAAYACVLTVQQAYEVRDIAPLGDLIVPSLVKINRLKFAAKCIQKCFRYYAAYKRKKNWNSQQPVQRFSTTSSTASSQAGSAPTAASSGGGSATKSRFSFFAAATGAAADRARMDASTHGSATTAARKDSAAASKSPVINGSSSTAGCDEEHGDSSDAVATSAGSGGSLTPPRPRPVSVERPGQSRRLFSNLFGLGARSHGGEHSSHGASSSGSPAAVLAVEAATSVDAVKRSAGGDSVRSRSPTKVNMLDYVSRCVVVAQKAFCITTTSQDYTFIFKVLDAIATAEARLGFNAQPLLALDALGVPQKQLQKKSFQPSNYTNNSMTRQSLYGRSFSSFGVTAGPDSAVSTAGATTAGVETDTTAKPHRWSQRASFQHAVMRECFLEQIEAAMTEKIQFGGDYNSRVLLQDSATAAGSGDDLFQQQNVINSPSRSRSFSAGQQQLSACSRGGVGKRRAATARRIASADEGVAIAAAAVVTDALVCIHKTGGAVVRKISVPLYIDEFRFDPKKLLSTKEWSFSVMFTHLSSQVIFKLINLLLMEKSIIIHGKNAGIVTSITLAVVNLIHPFVWEGIFVPLVPDNARELFGAPVPLIVGTTSPPSIQDVAPTTAILFLNDDSVVEVPCKPPTQQDQQDSAAASSSTAAANATIASAIEGKCGRGSASAAAVEFSAWFVRLPEVSADLPIDEEICKRIDFVRTLLCRHCQQQLEFCDEVTELLRHQFGALKTQKQPQPQLQQQLQSQQQHQSQEQLPLPPQRKSPVTARRGVIPIINSVDSILMENVPNAILSEVHILSRAFRRYIYRFIGREVIQDPSGWKRFLRYSSRTGEQEFYPEYFMEPLRNQLEFQEAMVHTQLFVSFMDRLRREHQQQEHLRLLLAEWLYFRWHRRKNRRQNQQS